MSQIGKNHHSDIDNPYLKSLQTIFKQDSTKEEKIDAFEEQGIVMDDVLESGVSDMCNYGSYVAASNRMKGRIEGRIEGTVESLRDMGIAEREIAEKIKTKYNLTQEEVDKYLGIMA